MGVSARPVRHPPPLPPRSHHAWARSHDEWHRRGAGFVASLFWRPGFLSAIASRPSDPTATSQRRCHAWCARATLSTSVKMLFWKKMAMGGPPIYGDLDSPRLLRWSRKRTSAFSSEANWAWWVLVADSTGGSSRECGGCDVSREQTEVKIEGREAVRIVYLLIYKSDSVSLDHFHITETIPRVDGDVNKGRPQHSHLSNRRGRV